jgi:hypothetical protein
LIRQIFALFFADNLSLRRKYLETYDPQLQIAMQYGVFQMGIPSALNSFALNAPDYTLLLASFVATSFSPVSAFLTITNPPVKNKHGTAAEKLKKPNDQAIVPHPAVFATNPDQIGPMRLPRDQAAMNNP